MSLLVVVGNDYWGDRARAICDAAGVTCAVDCSSSHKRALKLILRGSIPLRAAPLMWMAQRRWPARRAIANHAIHSNSELLALATKLKAERIVLFRAGLIISGKTLAHLDVRNIHCADVPEFGGLASIYRAIRARAYRQHATLHRVTVRIDEGEVLAREPYVMDAQISYSENENVAYEAGLRLLTRILSDR